jgi:3',5'-cyclic AMP phosphodiesterase CpdA
VPHLLTIPGNHDISLFNPFKRLFAPYRDYHRWINAELAPVIDLPDLLIIGVNTTRRYRHINGEVSERQVQSVARRLRAAGPAQMRIVVTHQPAWVIRPQDQHDRLRGHELALKEWAKSGADLVLGGHIHLPYIAAIHECLAGMARPLWVVQAGTALSSRVRAEADNSINLFELDHCDTVGAIAGEARGMRCTISRWDYQSGPELFSRISDFTINLHHEVNAGK